MSREFLPCHRNNGQTGREICREPYRDGAMANPAPIRRHHHITLCSGSAQEDYDFHTKVLSLKSVKKLKFNPIAKGNRPSTAVMAVSNTGRSRV